MKKISLIIALAIFAPVASQANTVSFSTTIKHEDSCGLAWGDKSGDIKFYGDPIGADDVNGILSIDDTTEIELTFSDTHHVSGDLDINQGYYKVEINDNTVGTTPWNTSGTMSLTGVQDQDRIDIGARTNQYRSEVSEGVHEISTMIELTCFDNSVLTQPSISSSN